ncbi:hypothetical protein PLEOSDRAFT_158892 [Pleurotus ostreatus PC15]|uniref:Uncharacterized protein n=1 Tax=Pleurotus ostreatus (strain PC15) TaxID=1137138 RepID=A0A067NGP0_PLEO1|nr:hypothetical protein PLEOSDRAFT_158892 [Pleurotus ostreatus PC15]
MTELPPEIHIAIIEEFDVDVDDDRKTILALLLVSRYWNSLALPKLYREITMHLLSSRFISHNIQRLRCLLRNIDNNAGLQFTTSFVLKAQTHAFDINPDDNLSDIMGRLISFFFNIRRLGLWMDKPSVNVRSLQSLPSSAPLTHLTLNNCSLSVDDLRQFLSAHPTLQWLALYSSKRSESSQDIQLPASALPHLLYLAMSIFEVVSFDKPLPSLVCLEIRSMTSTCISLDQIATMRQAAPCFNSIVACSLVNFPFVNISSALHHFPSLKYLRLQSFLDESFDYNILSATKLTYLLCYAWRGEANLVAPKVFESVKTMTVVDVGMPGSTRARMYNGEIQYPIYHRAGNWNAWWEEAERAVEFVNRLSVRSDEDRRKLRLLSSAT